MELCGESSFCSAHPTHAIGLNDVCDSLRHHGAKLGAIRGAVAPSRNTLSHANKHRNSDIMEELFWTFFGHLQSFNPKFELRRDAIAICSAVSSDLSMLSISPRLLWLPRPNTVAARPFKDAIA